MTELQAMRRDCAEKRFAYQHAREIYGEALRLLLPSDLTALRDELSQALLDYYSAHGALHGVLRRADASASSPPRVGAQRP